MTLLLHDLAEETNASNQRLADRLDEEARDLRRLERECEELRQKVTEPEAEVNKVRHATDAYGAATWASPARTPRFTRGWCAITGCSIPRQSW